MAEGFKIADGYLRVYTDYTDAERQETEFLRRSDDELDRAARRNEKRSRDSGRRSGEGFGGEFVAGLRRHLSTALGMVGGFARAIAVPLGAILKLGALAAAGGAIISLIGGLSSAVAGLIPLVGLLVQQLTSARLRETLQNSGDANNNYSQPGKSATQ